MKVKMFTLVSVAICAVLSLCGCGKKAKQEQAMSNLKQIGLGIKSYANMMRWEGWYPTDLNALIKTKKLTDTATYISPFDETSKKLTSGELTENNTSYVYLGNGLSESSAADAIVAFELSYIPEKKENVRIPVLFVDGHVGQFDIEIGPDSNVLSILDSLKAKGCLVTAQAYENALSANKKFMKKFKQNVKKQNTMDSILDKAKKTVEKIQIDTSIVTVKKGVFKLDETRTVDAAVNAVMRDVKWKKFTSKNNQNVVEVTGIWKDDIYARLLKVSEQANPILAAAIKLMPMPEDKILLQFAINADGESFQFSYGEITGKDGKVKNIENQMMATSAYIDRLQGTGTFLSWIYVTDRKKKEDGIREMERLIKNNQ